MPQKSPEQKINSPELWIQSATSLFADQIAYRKYLLSLRLVAAFNLYNRMQEKKVVLKNYIDCFPGGVIGFNQFLYESDPQHSRITPEIMKLIGLEIIKYYEEQPLPANLISSILSARKLKSKIDTANITSKLPPRK